MDCAAQSKSTRVHTDGLVRLGRVVCVCASGAVDGTRHKFGRKDITADIDVHLADFILVVRTDRQFRRQMTKSRIFLRPGDHSG